MQFKKTLAPVLPYNLTSWTNDGFELKDITGGKPLEIMLRVRSPHLTITMIHTGTLAYDVEDSMLGACIIGVTTSSQGSWQAKTRSGKWVTVSVKNKLTTASNPRDVSSRSSSLRSVGRQSAGPQSVLTAICLGPKDRIR